MTKGLTDVEQDVKKAQDRFSLLVCRTDNVIGWVDIALSTARRVGCLYF